MEPIKDLEILGVGVSPHKTDGVKRFEYFCNAFDLKYRILGDGKIWYGGDMSAGIGGGQKINEVLQAIENMDNKLLIICDTFDLFPIAGKDEILDKFNKLCQPDCVLFSSEVYCWPDKELENSYPLINTKYKFLNSGSIIGYRNNIYNLIKNGTINNSDDQLFYTLKYLAGEKIVIDHKCELFQALNGCDDDIIVHKNRIYNKYTNSYPIFIHGNGSAKIFINNIENYLEPYALKKYNFTMDSDFRLATQPKVFFALYIDSSMATEFNLFIRNVTDINYDNKIVFVYDKNNNETINTLVSDIGFFYQGGITTYIFDDFINCDSTYYFLLEQQCIITKKDILHELLPYCTGHQRIICPLLKSNKNKYFTNYWGAITNNGYYARSDDYLELVDYHKRGLWNSPYVSGALIMDRSIIVNWDLMKENKFNGDNRDMQLCYNFRKYMLFMYMANFNAYGYLVQTG